MKEHLSPLQKKLFGFARTADQLNAELLKLPTVRPDIEAIFALRQYLSLIARKAENVASRLTGQQKKRKAA